MSKRSRVWRVLAQHPEGVTCKTVAALLKMRRANVSKLLIDLRRMGLAAYEERGNYSLWWARGNGANLYEIGENPNSLDNLNSDRRTAVERLRLAFVARGIDPDKAEGRPPPVRPDSCTLAQCWSYASCTQQAGD